MRKPVFWGNFNTKIWSIPQNFPSKFSAIGAPRAAVTGMQHATWIMDHQIEGADGWPVCSSSPLCTLAYLALAVSDQYNHEYNLIFILISVEPHQSGSPPLKFAREVPTTAVVVGRFFFSLENTLPLRSSSLQIGPGPPEWVLACPRSGRDVNEVGSRGQSRVSI